MKYYCNFKDFDGNAYRIDLIPKVNTDNTIGIELTTVLDSVFAQTAATKHFFGAPSPIIVKSESEIYAPLITSGASITLVVDNNIMRDLYSPDPHGIQVLLRKNGVIIWRGYLTDNCYTQEYNNSLSYMQFEAICQLSTLGNYRFNQTYNSMMSIADLIRNSVIVSGAGYDKIYIQEHVREKANTGFCLDKIYIQNSNWYDENEDPMTYKDVIEEALKYSQLTMMAIGNNIYIYDIKCKSPAFREYSGVIYDKWDLMSIPFINTSIETLKSYGCDNTFDIKGTSNKINVIANFKSDSEFVPLFDKDKTVFIQELTYVNIDGAQVGDKHTVKKRYYKDPKFIYHRYSSVSGGELTDNELEIIDNYDAVLGAQFTRIAAWKNEADIPNRLNFEDVLQCKIATVKSQYVTEYLASHLPVFETILRYTAMQGCFLSINFDIKMAYSAHSLSHGDSFDRDIIIRVPCRLSIGDMYWAGKSWVRNSNTLFYLDVTVEKGAYRDSYVSVKDTNNYLNKVPDLTGYVFPTPNDELLIGEVKFVMFPPNVMDEVARKQAVYIFIKQLELRHQFPTDVAYSGDWTDDTDILYSNIVSNDYETTDQDIKCIVTTYDNTGVSLSSPIILSDDKFKYMRDLYWVSGNKTCIAEENIIDRYVAHYATPKQQLSLNTEICNPQGYYISSGREHIITGYNVNYQECSGTYRFDEL